MLIIFGIPLLISSGLLYHADLLYYIYAPAVFAAFSIIPVNIGIGMAIVVSSIFHIRRLKRSLVSTGIVAFVLLVTLLRVFRPERFVNPELFANLTFFISELNTPSFILLPNRWLSESLFGFLRNAFRTDTFIVFTLLFLTSYVTTLFLHGIFKRYHYRGWGLLQQGGILLKEKGARVHRTIPFLKRIGAILCVRQLARMVDRQSAALIRKDLLLQLRDPQNIHQMLILVSLIIIYLFSMASLPLNWEGYAVRLKYIISFFNLGLILIIIASLCSRLVYPAVVSEGASLWTIRISPVTSRRYIWTKFLAFLLPVFVLGQSLTIFSSFFLGTEKALLALNISTVGLLSFSLVSLGIAFGVADVRRTAVETAQGRTKTANTAHMLFSILLILFTLAVETIPFFLYFLKEARQTALTQKGWIIIGSILFLVSGVNSLITVVLLRSGVRKFEKVQFS
jgi:ABC-2 type transport system permease protein